MPRTHLLLASTALVLCLTACNPAPVGTGSSDSMSASDMAADDALPLAAGETTSEAVAPAVEALPAAPRPQVVYVQQPEEQYQYVDDASAMNSAFGDAPPDYGFTYDGGSPWVWMAADNAMRVVEPTSDGDRYYYYHPGDQEPYLVRDPQYAYAYDNGRLVSVYDSRGQVLAEADAERRADYAGRYLARARALETAARQDRRQQVNANAYAQRRAQINVERAKWTGQQRQTQAWQAYHARHESDEQTKWQAEQQRRQQAARDFDDWHKRGYQGPAPTPVQQQHRHDQQVTDQARQAQARQDAVRQDAQRQQQTRQQQQQLHDRQVAQQAQSAQARQNAAKQQQDQQRRHNEQVSQQNQEAHNRQAADAEARHRADVKVQQDAAARTLAMKHQAQLKHDAEIKAVAVRKQADAAKAEAAKAEAGRKAHAAGSAQGHDRKPGGPAKPGDKGHDPHRRHGESSSSSHP